MGIKSNHDIRIPINQAVFQWKAEKPSPEGLGFYLGRWGISGHCYSHGEGEYDKTSMQHQYKLSETQVSIQVCVV